jgi:enoyl-CoA hydratase/carnithine racemase
VAVSEATVLLERRDDGVAVLTLNRPAERNAMSAELLDAFAARVDELGRDRAVRAVVLTGAGNAFCAGADFTALGDLGARSGVAGPAGGHAALRSFYAAFLGIDRLDVPTIAAVNGAAVGGGLGLALLCDLRIVARTAKIGANFARLGIHSGLGITRRLPELVGEERAAELLFTGALVDGERAAAIGLALEAVDATEVLPRALALASRIATAAPLAVRHIKRTLRACVRRDLEPVLELEAFAQAMLMQTEDAREGIAAVLGKREPHFKGR